MKPSVDNKPPPQFQHLQLNLKKAQQEEGTWRVMFSEKRNLPAPASITILPTLMLGSKCWVQSLTTINKGKSIRLRKGF
jgi:hypothetical protein